MIERVKSTTESSSLLEKTGADQKVVPLSTELKHQVLIASGQLSTNAMTEIHKLAMMVEMEGLHVETGPVNVGVEPVGCLIVWNTKMPWFKTSFSGFVFPFYKLAVIKLYVIT